MKAKQRSITDYVPKGIISLLVAATLLASIVPIASERGMGLSKTSN